MVQPEDPKPTRNAIFNMYTAEHPIQGVGVVKVPYPLFHMEFSDVVEHGTSEREKAQGPPTVGMVKRTLFKKVRLSLGDDERWIYLTEDTFDTMTRVNITQFHRCLTENGEKPASIGPESVRGPRQHIRMTWQPPFHDMLSLPNFLLCCAWPRI